MKYFYRLACLVGVLALVLVAQNGTQHSITLNWAADATATGGFNVYRGTTSGGPYSKIGSVVAGVLTYKDTSAMQGTQYFYVVTGIDTNTPLDESAYSNQATGTEPINPAAPTGVTATVQ